MHCDHHRWSWYMLGEILSSILNIPDKLPEDVPPPIGPSAAFPLIPPDLLELPAKLRSERRQESKGEENEEKERARKERGKGDTKVQSSLEELMKAIARITVEHMNYTDTISKNLAPGGPQAPDIQQSQQAQASSQPSGGKPILKAAPVPGLLGGPPVAPPLPSAPPIPSIPSGNPLGGGLLG